MKVMIAALLACLVCSSALRAEQPADVSDLSRGQIFNLEVKRAAALEQGAEFSLPLPFSFPSDARPESVFGIDVSHHNFDRCKCKASWDNVAAARVLFAYVKATQGTSYVDPMFSENWRSLASSRVHRGAYHFLSADGDAIEQAKHFVSIIRSAGEAKGADMPPSLDVEWDIRTKGGKIVLGTDGKPLDHWTNVPPQEIVDRMSTWLWYVEKELGRTPIVYTSRAWWLGRLRDETLMQRLEKYQVWIADYSASGRGTERPSEFKDHLYTLWQFSDSATIKDGATSGDLGADVSIFRGDDFRKQFKLY